MVNVILYLAFYWLVNFDKGRITKIREKAQKKKKIWEQKIHERTKQTAREKGLLEREVRFF